MSKFLWLKNYEVEGGEEHNPTRGPRHILKDTDGKVIIRPFGKGWTPSSCAADAIGDAIQKQFRGPHYNWTATPDDVKDFWWRRFKDKVSWDPCHNHHIHKTFEQKCAKRLSDILQKARKKAIKPKWMGDEAWAGLVAYWASAGFKQLSAQNKTNRASKKGGAAHTSGRKSHVDVALDMDEQLGRHVEPHELFLATHKSKSGEWVDSRSQRTYESYLHRLSQLQTELDEASPGETQELDRERKLELWQEVVGGKTRGRCYGTADLSSNLRPGISALTQESRAPSGRSGGSEDEMRATRAAAARALEEAAVAREKAARAEALYDDLAGKYQTMMERMTAMERQSGGASCTASQPRPHPDYDDDLDEHSLDEASPDSRCR